MKKINKKSAIISLIIFIITILIIGIRMKINKSNKENNQENWENPYTEIDKNEAQYQENTNIDDIKQQTGITGDTSIYEINTEYDGRKILNVKPDIQYKVAFAGIIKQQLPNKEEIDNIVKENYPNKKGIWIDERSRNGFLKLLEGNTNSQYEINKEGYLLIKNKNNQNENDKIIEKWITSEKNIIITISDKYYEIDNVTGEIVEYPFEKLDKYQTYDQIKSDNNTIIVITSNSEQQLTNKEIIDDLRQLGQS